MYAEFNCKVANKPILLRQLRIRATVMICVRIMVRVGVRVMVRVCKLLGSD